jgi:hypothetical protein
MKLINTTTHQVLATIHSGALEVTQAGKNALLPYDEPIQVPLCETQLFEGREWINPEDANYANAFYLFTVTTIMKNRTDLKWERGKENTKDEETAGR